mmetsp:Transcript_11594/g.16908  ORF Transcript_11594/g.16908 Transcript_11594/m.16908 type:complete len:99 (+) Transcript_11594:163-459(+)
MLLSQVPALVPCSIILPRGPTATITRSLSTLLQKVEDNVLTLTLNREKQRNALNTELLHEIKSALTKTTTMDHSSTEDDDVRAIVIQANGPVFCSGHA